MKPTIEGIYLHELREIVLDRTEPAELRIAALRVLADIEDADDNLPALLSLPKGGDS